MSGYEAHSFWRLRYFVLFSSWRGLREWIESAGLTKMNPSTGREADPSVNNNQEVKSRHYEIALIGLI